MSANNKLLCLTICGYKKPSMSQADYRAYMTDKHAPLVQEIMARYGMLSYTQIHCSNDSRALMDRIVDPQFANLADYDCIITATFPDVENFVRMKADPFYQKYIAPDHENFADTRASKMTIGWVEGFVRDGIVLNTEPKLLKRNEESTRVFDGHANKIDGGMMMGDGKVEIAA